MHYKAFNRRSFQTLLVLHVVGRIIQLVPDRDVFDLFYKITDYRWCRARDEDEHWVIHRNREGNTKGGGDKRIALAKRIAIKGNR
jgi:hypothetical protein